MSENLALLKLVVPEILFEYFEVTKQETKATEIHLYFEEINDTTFLPINRKVHSKGFYKESVVQDFPLRGKSVYLHIKRRKWEDIKTKEIVSRDWKMVATGTRMTSEFATFLKELHLNILR